jgi:putative ABC transport system permease protein
MVTECRDKYICFLSCLQNFAYRVNLRIGIFLLSGLAALALLTFSYQIIKAATANPADSLRYE